MAQSARTHASWMSALVVVAVCASCVTRLYAPTNNGYQIINSTVVANMLRTCQNASHTAHGTFKVSRNVNQRLTWVEECCVQKLTLDQSKSRITVEEKGIYLIYLQVTYSLNKTENGSKSVDLELWVNFSHTENNTQLVAAYDTRKVTENVEDAHLSSFFLLNMQAKESLSVQASPGEQISCEYHQPYSSYITIIKYADW